MPHSAARFHVADILRDHVRALVLGAQPHRVVCHLLACRTDQLGGHRARCDRCGAVHFAYHSCRDRHCPTCGSLDQALWAEAQLQHLLPVSCFHLVHDSAHAAALLHGPRPPSRPGGSVRHRGPDVARSRSNQLARTPRRPRRAAHLDPAPRPPPPPALPGAGRRSRRRPMGGPPQVPAPDQEGWRRSSAASCASRSRPSSTQARSGPAATPRAHSFRLPNTATG